MMKNIIPSTLQDIKRMFASEHVMVVTGLFGTHYINPNTKKKISKKKAMKILNGEY